MAEWLRRQIRNLMGSARMGSNPIIVAYAKKKYIYICEYILCDTVAQLDSALDFESNGCGFESRQCCVLYYWSLWRNWITRRPPKVKIAGSNPARDAHI